MNEIEEWFYRTYIAPDSETPMQVKKIRGDKPIMHAHRCSVCGWAINNMEAALSVKKGRTNPLCIYCLRGAYDLRYEECGLPKNDWRYRTYV